MKDYLMEAEELCYSYPDGTKALNGLGIKIRAQTTAILGGNGAGKSTLFKCFNGILKPTSGKVIYDEREVNYSHKGLKELRSLVGIVFQDPDSQLFSASVYQDISFGATNLKLPEEEVRRRVEIAMDRTGVTSLKISQHIVCLSFGQKKRVAIAGVLVMEPKLLILDEPTAGLDPQGVSEIMKLLEETQKELGLSVIISTHDIDIVPLHCDYCYVMNEGTVVLEGKPKEVFARADVLRSVNLRLPRIAHLLEILKDKDNFDFQENATTISEARKEINEWRARLERNK